MGRDFCGEVRGAARSALPEGTFLRRDRGGALYVTDAPGRDPGGAWREKLETRGFICELDGALARLSPGPAWLAALEARHPEPPDAFTAAFRRFGGPPDQAALALFAMGLKALESGQGCPEFERGLRQRAAVCLRDHLPGGGLYACALVRFEIGREMET